MWGINITGELIFKSRQVSTYHSIPKFHRSAPCATLTPLLFRCGATIGLYPIKEAYLPRQLNNDSKFYIILRNLSELKNDNRF